MPKFQVTLATVVSITATVEADDEDTAVDDALKSARGFSGQWHAGHNWTADFNDEWQYEEPKVTELP